MNLPQNLKYTKTHEWARLEADGSVTIGITDHAQSLLGDMVYVELPALDREVKQEAEISVVESVKAASDVYSPLSGKIIAVNQDLSAKPELVNQDPYEAGWLFKLQPVDSKELENLLTPEAYHALHSAH